MQNAKDTFYVTLRNRLATLNPNRTMLLRGVQRPGILVEEAEAVVPMLPSDVFVLRWTALSTDVNLPLVLARLECEILYTTGGTQAGSGLDRGRALEEMDAEVLGLLSPNCAPKMNYTQTPPVQLNTPIFWSAADFTLRSRCATVCREAPKSLSLHTRSRENYEHSCGYIYDSDDSNHPKSARVFCAGKSRLGNANGVRPVCERIVQPRRSPGAVD
jgi:hypothetical protein